MITVYAYCPGFISKSQRGIVEVDDFMGFTLHHVRWQATGMPCGWVKFEFQTKDLDDYFVNGVIKKTLGSLDWYRAGELASPIPQMMRRKNGQLVPKPKAWRKPHLKASKPKAGDVVMGGLSSPQSWDCVLGGKKPQVKHLQDSILDAIALDEWEEEQGISGKGGYRRFPDTYNDGGLRTTITHLYGMNKCPKKWARSGREARRLANR